MRRLTKMMRIVAVTIALLMVTSGCGDEVDVPEKLRSAPTEEFKLVTNDDGSYVVGHGIALQMGDGWVDYEPELDSLDGTTREWAVGQPVSATPFPAGLQFSMAVPGHGAQVDTGMEVAVEKVAELMSDYEFVDKGEVDVPGAEEAKFLRFTHDLDYNGTVTRAEQVTLMIKVSDDTSSTIRFIAPEGQWDELMESAYESVKVTTG